VYHKINSATFIVESDTLCWWKTASLYKQVFWDTFLRAVEFICDAYWFNIILNNFELSYLEIWRQHCCLKSASSCDAICAIKCSRWVSLEHFLNLLNTTWNSCSFSNKLNKVNFVGCKPYITKFWLLWC
jgi:hypothetical protein